jgi:hypothetical protein
MCKLRTGVRPPNFLWCGEPCFAVAAISLDGYLLILSSWSQSHSLLCIRGSDLMENMPIA